jgi:hypothetical protein
MLTSQTPQLQNLPFAATDVSTWYTNIIQGLLCALAELKQAGGLQQWVKGMGN